MENLQLQNNSSNVGIKNGLSLQGKLLIGITGGVGIGLSILCFPFVSPAFRRVCLPYVPATDVQVRNVLAAVKGRSGRLLDIGSGDGRIVVAAAKEGFKADGVELNPWLVVYSRLSALAHRVQGNASFYRKDLWRFSVRPYDTVVVFGVEEMMCELERKLEGEMMAGGVVVACRFPLQGRGAQQVVGEGVDTVWKYQY